MKIAIQGEAGAFSHEAAQHMVPGCSIVACARSAAVFDQVQKGSVAAAVIPIENSLAGSVAEHLDLLLARQVFIQREFRLRIRHNVIAAPGIRFKELRRVFSHPVALDQCRDFFDRFPKIEPVPFYDTAGSVKHVIERNLRDSAGNAGRQAASVYGGKILKAGIEDDKANFTRFFLIRKKRGVLVSLSKIESRPMRGRPWEYVFYVDILRGEDQAARNALRHLGEVADLVKVLGIYPAA